MFQFSSGSILGRYELLVPIASGGMAEVWAARLHGTRGFTKLVAIKTIRKGVMDDTRLERMLLAEAHLAARIEHPNVVSTLELAEQSETLFLVMEWVDGEPLSLLMDEGRASEGIPLPIAVNIIAQACKGIHCAHELTDDEGHLLGVVHRDVSPQNVLVTYTGMVKLVDFGIAKATHRSNSMTEEGEVKGKLTYMSPEQVKGESIDRRTDVFALGTILYALTTGQHPFRGNHPGETLAKLFSGAPMVPPTRLVANYPKPLEQVVLKALRKDRNERYATAHDLLVALEAAVPEARGIESDVAAFLKTCADGRGDKRRQSIRAAGELLDQRNPGDITGTGTSLSAMSVGFTGSHLALQRAELEAQSDPGFRKPSKVSWIAGAVISVCAVATLWLVIRSGRGTEGTATLAASAQSLPAVATDWSRPPPITTTSTHGATDAGASKQDESDEGSTERTSNVSRKASTKPPRTANAPRATRTQPEAVPTPTSPSPNSAGTETTAQAPAAAPSSRDKRAPTKNSWDPKTFGGRL